MSKNRGLSPDHVVAERYGVHPRTLKRWDEKPDLKFPPPIEINGRTYRENAALDAWDKYNICKVTSASTAEKLASVKHARDKKAAIRRAETGA
jgi:hypothetical protein